MQNYSKTHHQLIRTALENFNHDFLAQHRILFGGGTRIALELSEYRESIDIDFWWCFKKYAEKKQVEF